MREQLRAMASRGDDRAKALLALLEQLEEHGAPAKARGGRWRVECDGVRMRLIDCAEGASNTIAEVANAAPERAAWWLAIVRVGRQ
jgi:hypothetical protein